MTMMNPKLKAIGVFALGIIGFILLLRYQRHQELLNFFTIDHRWSRLYADRKLNFCEIKEWSSSVEGPKDLAVLDMSPSGRYLVKDLHKLSADHFGLAIEDGPSGKNVIVMPQANGGSEVRWSADERYAVILQGVESDNDLGTARIFLGNLANGEIIYLADSTRSNCAEGGW